jgi:hypothetical protein
MGQIIDTMIVYQILRKLVTPFIQMPAYHMGIIDEHGDFLKKVATLTTAEKETVTTLDVLVINLKRILGKLPGGASRLASLAAALYLIRAHGKVNESNITDTLFTLEEDFNRYLAEDAPVNATGPAIAGTHGDTVVTNTAAKRYKAKNKKMGIARRIPTAVVEAHNDFLSKNKNKLTPHKDYASFVKANSTHIQNHVDSIKKEINSFNGLDDKQKAKKLQDRMHRAKTEVTDAWSKLNEDISLQYHNNLNPKLWDDGQLKPEVRGKLIQFAETWRDFAMIPKEMVQDIVMTGGNANYNYTDQSDIDVHLVVDRDGFGMPRDFIDQFLQDKKILWTMTHPDIKVYGYPLEPYAQDPAEAIPMNQGQYSLMNAQWIQMPSNLNLDFTGNKVLQDKVDHYKHVIDRLIRSSASDAALKTIKNKITSARGPAIAKGGEFSLENLVFKELRNQGYIDKIDAYVKSEQDKALSL